MNTRAFKFAPPSEERPDPELVIKYVFKGYFLFLKKKTVSYFIY